LFEEGQKRVQAIQRSYSQICRYPPLFLANINFQEWLPKHVDEARKTEVIWLLKELLTYWRYDTKESACQFHDKTS
jgi:hypothetical protein